MLGSLGCTSLCWSSTHFSWEPSEMVGRVWMSVLGGGVSSSTILLDLSGPLQVAPRRPPHPGSQWGPQEPQVSCQRLRPWGDGYGGGFDQKAVWVSPAVLLPWPLARESGGCYLGTWVFLCEEQEVCLQVRGSHLSAVRRCGHSGLSASPLRVHEPRLRGSESFAPCLLRTPLPQARPRVQAWCLNRSRG